MLIKTLWGVLVTLSIFGYSCQATKTTKPEETKTTKPEETKTTKPEEEEVIPPVELEYPEKIDLAQQEEAEVAKLPPLHSLAKNPEKFFLALKKFNFHLNQLDEYGHTALFYAAFYYRFSKKRQTRHQYRKVVKWILKHPSLDKEINKTQTLLDVIFYVGRHGESVANETKKKYKPYSFRQIPRFLKPDPPLSKAGEASAQTLREKIKKGEINLPPLHAVVSSGLLRAIQTALKVFSVDNQPVSPMPYFVFVSSLIL